MRRPPAGGGGGYQAPAALVEIKGRQLYLTILGVLLGLLLAALDQTIVATALPRMVADLGGLDKLAWVVTAYMLTSTAGVPIWGKLSDLYGRRRFFIAGLILFIAASMLTGTAQSMNQLIAFRALQGVGGGMMFGLAFVIVSDFIPPAERGKWQGLFGAVFATAGIVGPLVGGFLTDNLSWRWAFYINLPVGVLALAVIWPSMPPVKPNRGRPIIDYLGVATLLGTIVPLLLGLSLAGRDYAWSSPLVLGLLTGSGGMLAAFLLIESKSKEPIVPLHLFRNPIFAVSAITTFLTGIGMFGSIIFIPLFVQGVVGASATSSGLVIMPMMLSVVASSTISGQLISRTGRYRLLAVIGPVIMTVGAFLLSAMNQGSGQAIVIRNMMIMGFGLGMTFPVFLIAVQNAFPFSVMGVVTALVQFFRSLGGTVGVAVLGSLLTIRLDDALRKNIPPEVNDRVPLESLGRLSSPESLVDEGSLAQLRERFDQVGPDGPNLFNQFLDGLRLSLADSITHVFLIGAVIVSFSAVTALFLRELKLRTSVFEPLEGEEAPSGPSSNAS